MKIAPLFLFFFLMSNSLFAQEEYTISGTPPDTFMAKTSISLNAGELIDGSHEEFNCRVALEQKIVKKIYLLIEPGIYFTGTGYNIKTQIKRYVSNENGERIYLAIDFFHKEHYCTETIFLSGTNRKDIYLSKTINAAHFLIGGKDIISKKHRSFFIDSYFGVGVRIRDIFGISSQDYAQVQSWLMKYYLQSGLGPDITFGVRIGYDFGRKHTLATQ